MSQSKYLLDTSAVFTFLEDEAGAERVETLLRQEVILLSYITLLETYYITFQEQSGRFKAYHRLSLADAMIAAFAQRQGAILIHKDPEFEALIEVVEQEMLPYKIPQSDFSRTE